MALAPAPLHVAIIMDGNGRWATARGSTRSRGHREGAEAVRRVVRAASPLGIRTLTLFAFSCDNWHRPTEEVSSLLRLFSEYLRTEMEEWAARRIRVAVIGRRDRLPAALLDAVETVEQATRSGDALHLRIAIDYSSRDAILRAAQLALSRPASSPEEFSYLLGEADCSQQAASDVDLLIRTGGEMRLSDFLLWECAYAELVFTETMWPEFGAGDLEAAVAEFHSRERRFGRLPDRSVRPAPGEVAQAKGR